MTLCKNCNEQFQGNYCPNCGTPNHFKRIDRKHVSEELMHNILHLENGFLYTVKELMTNPGNSIRTYINGNRTKYFKPIGFVVLTSLMFGFVNHYFLNSVELNKFETGGFIIFQWMQNNYVYVNLLQMAFIAFAFKFIFYRKSHYNVFEFFILMAFITGEIMFIGSFFIIISSILHSVVPAILYLLLSYFYTSWVIGDFFKAKRFSGYLRTLFIYACCTTAFGSIFVLIALITN